LENSSAITYRAIGSIRSPWLAAIGAPIQPAAAADIPGTLEIAPEFAEGLRDLGIPAERILAAEVRVKDGIITSEIINVPTDEAKAEALKRVGLPHPDAVFGNSIHDLAMLELARCPFPVNPSPSLVEAAARKGWGYYRPKAAEGINAAVMGESASKS